ncbi:MAG: hypothetical protein NVSMB52_11660 [Chloroflexota bacterium]
MMGQTPFAGIAWQVLQYLEGFRRLGFDVYYVEDTRTWPFDPEKNSVTEDCSYAVNYIETLMNWCRLPGRWFYRSGANGVSYGLTEDRMSTLLKRADILVNLTAATVLRDEHSHIPVRIYLETDPVLPQIEIAQNRQQTIDLLAAHTHHFTYGENFGAPDCAVPVGLFTYHPTRQPVVLDWWSNRESDRAGTVSRFFTTVGNWKQGGKDIEWNGEMYRWSKHHEFMKFIDLPHRTSQPLEVALSQADTEALRLLDSHGWSVINAATLSLDLMDYHDYIQNSRGEFTVAKDQNIRLRSGWFSDRSACYLASGRPVITQDTAFANALPTGEGLFDFSTTEDVVEALARINSDYQYHSARAQAVADEYFKAETVLAKMMRTVGF